MWLHMLAPLVLTAAVHVAPRALHPTTTHNFDTFITYLNLMYRDVMFVSDLPQYIIPTGNWILQAN